jgi:phytoene dehydrogenase-like protein
LAEPEHDAIVVGSGPNGLAAAVTLARAGRRVLVLEAADTIGGGCRTRELTLPGFRHDVCSAFHPLATASPFFRDLPLAEHGLELVHPPAPLAHPLDGGTAVVLERSLEETAAGLGEDGAAWRKLYGPLIEHADTLVAETLAPIRPYTRHPLVMTRFGLLAVRSATGLARARFKGERARALFAGLAGHSVLPLERAPSASFGLMLGMMGHSAGWPVARGGSQAIADALASYLLSLGGEIRTSTEVGSVDDLPASRTLMLDVSPRDLVRLAGERLPAGYKRSLARYRHGPGVFKLDWALDRPIPWQAAECARAGTVHLGGTLEEIAAAEAAPFRGEHAEQPYVLVGQQSLFDDTRAPEGKHTGWAYCHVPNGSDADMTERIEGQLERFAPGFGAAVLARHAMAPADFETYNPNYVGGDIVGGMHTLRQLVFRPAPRPSPYRTPARGIYLCSSSTPPGGGVHGMCGFLAANAALRAG